MSDATSEERTTPGVGGGLDGAGDGLGRRTVTATVARPLRPAWWRGVRSLGSPRAGAVIAVVTAISVAAIGGSQGGFFPTAWGWCVAAFSWAAALSLAVIPRIQLGRAELAFGAVVAALVAWIGLSIMWSQDASGSVLEFQRALVYGTAVVVILLAVRARTVPALLGGVLAGVAGVCAFALLTRLFPAQGQGLDEVVQNRLSRPLGYWNALGIFAVMGTLLALGFTAHGRTRAIRVLGAACIPVLLTTQYFTYSRGSWIALAAALVAVVAVDPRRLRLLTTAIVVAPAPAIAVALAASYPGLTRLRAPHDVIAHEGRRLALILLALVAGAALLRFVFDQVDSRVSVPRRVRLGYAAGLAVVAIASLGFVVFHYGGPSAVASKAYHSFKEYLPARASAHRGGNLNDRLFTLRNNGRLAYWKVAWRDHDAHPWIGAGAGTFEQRWLRERTFPGQVLDAHGLYAETGGELGWIGLGLLAGVLMLPLATAVRARAHPLAAATFGVTVAYVVSAGVDWDWEVPAVTLVMLACGASSVILAGDRRRAPRLTVPTAGRVATLVVLGAVVAFSVVGLLGNRAISRSSKAYDAENWPRAIDQAKQATRWMSWSGEAWRQLGEAQLAARRNADARASLTRATREDPGDWVAWYDLGSASVGEAQRLAYVRAATLNPLEPAVALLRKLGYRLPRAPRGRQ
jgi:hypothetical protein